VEKFGEIANDIKIRVFSINFQCREFMGSF
jgi:hypothetical protein